MGMTYLSIIALIMFIFIIWESLVSQRDIMFSSRMTSSIEWNP